MLKPVAVDMVREQAELEKKQKRYDDYGTILKALNLSDNDVTALHDGIPKYGYRYDLHREFDTIESALEWLENLDIVTTYCLKGWATTFVPETSALVDETQIIDGNEIHKYNVHDSMPWICRIDSMNTGHPQFRDTRKIEAYINAGLDLPIQVTCKVAENCIRLDVIYSAIKGGYRAEYRGVIDEHRHFVNGKIKYASGGPEYAGQVVVW